MGIWTSEVTSLSRDSDGERKITCRTYQLSEMVMEKFGERERYHENIIGIYFD
jgi:hypothetical protein